MHCSHPLHHHLRAFTLANFRGLTKGQGSRFPALREGSIPSSEFSIIQDNSECDSNFSSHHTEGEKLLTSHLSLQTAAALHNHLLGNLSP